MKSEAFKPQAFSSLSQKFRKALRVQKQPLGIRTHLRSCLHLLSGQPTTICSNGNLNNPPPRRRSPSNPPPTLKKGHLNPRPRPPPYTTPNHLRNDRRLALSRPQEVRALAREHQRPLSPIRRRPSHRPDPPFSYGCVLRERHPSYNKCDLGPTSIRRSK